MNDFSVTDKMEDGEISSSESEQEIPVKREQQGAYGDAYQADNESDSGDSVSRLGSDNDARSSGLAGMRNQSTVESLVEPEHEAGAQRETLQSRVRQASAVARRRVETPPFDQRNLQMARGRNREEPLSFDYGGNERRGEASTSWRPAGHSTTGRRHERNSATFRGGNTNESSMWSAPKSIKVQPFPKDIPDSDKSQRWKFWLSITKLALERAGFTGQRERAVELSMSVGEEVGVIIQAWELLKDPVDVGDDYPFFDSLVEGITEHFASLTDENINVSEFLKLRQGDTETVRAYYTRVRMASAKVGVAAGQILNSVFLEGLKDEELRKLAKAMKMPISQVLEVGTSREHDERARQAHWFPPRGESSGIVAAVNQEAVQGSSYQRSGVRRQDLNRGESSKRPREVSGSSDRRSSPERRKKRRREEGGKCDKCGNRHESRICRAISAKCHACGQTGHFKAMCPKKSKQVHNIHSSDDDEKV